MSDQTKATTLMTVEFHVDLTGTLDEVKELARILQSIFDLHESDPVKVAEVSLERALRTMASEENEGEIAVKINSTYSEKI